MEKKNLTFEANVKEFVLKTLKPFIKDDKILKEAIKGKSLKTFLNAFTHVSIDSENNYEKLETLGDACIKSIFYTYLIHNHYHDITSHS